MTTLFSWTSPAGHYPPFVNITLREDGSVTVTVRGQPIVREFNGAQHPDAGATAEATLPPNELGRLMKVLIEHDGL